MGYAKEELLLCAQSCSWIVFALCLSEVHPFAHVTGKQCASNFRFFVLSTLLVVFARSWSPDDHSFYQIIQFLGLDLQTDRPENTDGRLCP